MLHSRSGELEESPKNHLSDAARAEREVARRLREHRELVKKITRRLYTTKRNSMEAAEHREVQSKVLNARAESEANHATGEGGALAIESEQHSQLVSVDDRGHQGREGQAPLRAAGRTRQSAASAADCPAAAAQERVVHAADEAADCEDVADTAGQLQQAARGEESCPHAEDLSPQVGSRACPDSPYRPIARGRTAGGAGEDRDPASVLLRERHHEAFPRVPAETVRAQLTRDMKRVETKLRLLVSSLLLLEEEIKQCTSECMREKKRLLQKRANSLYTLMDFLKDTRERASQYIRQIDLALSAQDACGVTKFRHEEDNGEWLSHLGEAVTLMAAHGKAIDFVASQVEVRRRAEITKKELVKYEQVTFSAVVPKIMGRHSLSSL